MDRPRVPAADPMPRTRAVRKTSTNGPVPWSVALWRFDQAARSRDQATAAPTSNPRCASKCEGCAVERQGDDPRTMRHRCRHHEHAMRSAESLPPTQRRTHFTVHWPAVAGAPGANFMTRSTITFIAALLVACAAPVHAQPTGATAASHPTARPPLHDPFSPFVYDVLDATPAVHWNWRKEAEAPATACRRPGPTKAVAQTQTEPECLPVTKGAGGTPCTGLEELRSPLQ